MKKKYIKIFVIICVLSMLFIIPFVTVKPPKLDADKINRIEFATLPSPPREKIITKKSDIQKIASIMNGLNLTPRIPISNPAGTSVWINTSGSQTLNISVTGGNIVQINKLSFKCNEDAAKKMQELYKTLDYREKKYS